MGMLDHLLDLGQYFTHRLSSVSICHISGVWVMVIGSDQTCMSPEFGLQIRLRNVCIRLFEVLRSDLKKWVLKFVALYQSEGEVGPAPLGQQAPH